MITRQNEKNITVDRSYSAAQVFVWGIWLLMIMAALVALVRYSHNIPLAEDWLLVAPLTGNDPDLLAWFWQQNNEHRIPIPRAILLGLLWVMQGDFRAGMVLNIAVLGLLSWAMIRVAQSLRGGRLAFTDAFFPIVLLHLGHWENLFWGWQFTQVFPTIVACVVLLLFVYHRDLTKPAAAVTAGICLVILPLCGANGLLYVPPLAGWLIVRGGLGWREKKTAVAKRWPAVLLMGAGIVALAMTTLYFVGYERPEWAPPNPGIVPSLVTAVQFIAFGFGPIARDFWNLTAGAALLLLFSSFVILLLALRHHIGLERQRALGMSIFLGSVLFYALAFGWGRSGTVVLDNNWPLRYVLLSAPALCTAYFVWLLYGPARLQPAVAKVALGLVLLFLPINTIEGLQWNDWYQEQVAALSYDIEAGLPHQALAERHNEFLVHWWQPNQLAEAMQMLQAASIGPFVHVQPGESEPVVAETAVEVVTETSIAPHSLTVDEDATLVTQEISYHTFGATEVQLIWGVDGWHTVPASLWTAQTEVRDNLMHTNMTAEGNRFVTTLQLPASTTLDYGFLVTPNSIWHHAVPIWHGNHVPEIMTEDSILDVYAKDTPSGMLSYWLLQTSKHRYVLLSLMSGISLIFGTSIFVHRYANTHHQILK